MSPILLHMEQHFLYSSDKLDSMSLKLSLGICCLCRLVGDQYGNYVSVYRKTILLLSSQRPLLLKGSGWHCLLEISMVRCPSPTSIPRCYEICNLSGEKWNQDFGVGTLVPAVCSWLELTAPCWPSGLWCHSRWWRWWRSSHWWVCFHCFVRKCWVNC